MHFRKLIGLSLDLTATLPFVGLGSKRVSLTFDLPCKSTSG